MCSAFSVGSMNFSGIGLVGNCGVWIIVVLGGLVVGLVVLVGLP